MAMIRTLALVAVATASLTACYIVPVARQDGTVMYQHYPLPPAGSPMPATMRPSMPAMPAVLFAKLYPVNELATQTGVVSGTVTNMMTGKGQFQLNYLGDVLTGEATRVSNSEKRGVANAYGPRGTYMSCEYEMNTPLQGAGTCTFSNGAKYQVHLGAN